MNRFSSERGFSIVYVLLFLGFAALIGAGLSRSFVANVQGTREIQNSSSAYYAAEGELEQDLHTIAAGGTVSSSECSAKSPSCTTVRTSISSDAPIEVTLAAGQEFQLNFWNPSDWRQSITSADVQLTVETNFLGGCSPCALEFTSANWTAADPGVLTYGQIFAENNRAGGAQVDRTLVTVAGQTLNPVIPANHNAMLRFRAIGPTTIRVYPTTGTIPIADTLVVVKGQEYDDTNTATVQRALSAFLPAVPVTKPGYDWVLYTENPLIKDGI